MPSTRVFGRLCLSATVPERGPVLYEATLNYCDLYLLRITRGTGAISGSRPCRECIRLLASYGVTRIFYTNDDGTVTIEKVREMKSTHSSAGYRNFFVN